MKPVVEQLILNSVVQANLLPITTTCNVRCLFCSNPQNPPEIETYDIPPMVLPKVEELLEFIDPGRKIVIGESATRINEGEPLTHPHFKEIILCIRQRFPHITVQLTTNGIRLNADLVNFLAGMGSIELNISLNSLGKRPLIMGINEGQPITAKIQLLAKSKIPFNGSIVAMPHQTGWKDLQDTITFLAESGARSTRVFVPGYTKWSIGSVDFQESVWTELHNFIRGLRKNVDMPIAFEPQLLDNLEATIEGIGIDTPARKAGLLIDDRILSINGEPVFSRLDAFNKMRSLGGQIILKIARDGGERTIELDKEAGAASGVMMSFDIDPDTLQEIARRVRKGRYENILILASELGTGIMSAAIKMGFHSLCPGVCAKVITIRNNYFGGSIKSAGLLLVQDILQSMKTFKKDGHIDAVFIPGIAFDAWGRDLKGVHYLELANYFSGELEIL